MHDGLRPCYKVWLALMLSDSTEVLTKTPIFLFFIFFFFFFFFFFIEQFDICNLLICHLPIFFSNLWSFKRPMIE